MITDEMIEAAGRVAKASYIGELHERKKCHEDNVARILPELLYPLIYDPSISPSLKTMAEELMESIKRISELEVEIEREHSYE